MRLDPSPDEWEVTGQPPEFVDGLDIPDPEFEEWVRDQRLAFADRYEQLSPALTEIRVARPEPEQRGAQPPSIAVLPIEILGGQSEPPSSPPASRSTSSAT